MVSRVLLTLLLVTMISGASYAQNEGNGSRISRLLVRVPFETRNGSIILRIRLNNSPRILRMLFDTGADGIAISQSLADSIGLKINRKQNASVVGGNMEIQISDGNTVALDTFEVKNQSIAVFKTLEKDLDGIIGNNIARKYITKIDYDRKEFLLYNFGDYQYEKDGMSLPFSMPSGLFILTGSLSITTEPAHTGEFVFDTGAAYHLICFRPFVKKNLLLVNGFKAEYHGSTTSMGMTTPTFSGKASSFQFSSMPPIKNMPVTLMAGGGQSENWNPGFDGSIGVRLISRYNFTINMQKKEIHFSPNSTFGYPPDFSIGGYLLGFNPGGELVVLGLTATEKQKIVLKTGTRIKSINGISSAIILKERKKFNELLALPEGTSYLIESEQEGRILKNLITK